MKRVLKSTRFQKLALDADLIDQNLASVSVDLIYRRLCGSFECMTFDIFLDAIVQLALVKYPTELSPQEALQRLYNECLCNFSSPGGLLDRPSLDPSVLGVIGRSELLMLYKGYFRHELNCNFLQRFSSPEAMSKQCLIQLLTDYDVSPLLLDKSSIFQIYRNVTTQLFQPLGMGVNCGIYFTFHHFLVSILSVSREIFPDPAEPDSVCLVGLLMHMDLSNGKAKARQASLIVPDKVAKKAIAKKKSVQSKIEPIKNPVLDVSTMLLSNPKILERLSHFELGIQAQFHHYSENGWMSISQFSRFITSNGLPSSETVFNRLQNEGSLDLGAFRLALVLIADTMGEEEVLEQKIVKFFAHVNAHN